jgi:H+-translocating NAD(P) transhydrogenase subunit alpha
MKLGVLKETTAGETRVALVPAHIPALQKRGFDVLVEPGAGFLAGYEDAAYEEKGATLLAAKQILQQAEVLCVVRGAAASDDGESLAKQMTKKQLLVGMLEPYQPHPSFDALLKNQVTSFSLEMIPRTTRAQSMDVLSSMANLAGYKAVLLGADVSPKMFPMMMTAAGTIAAAKVFVLGVGVAGLQAIATARRLGALVYAYDIRPEVKEQVLSLGAKFIEFDLESASGEGGYAKQMDEAYYEKQRQLMIGVIKDMDIVITTANVPGKKAPILVTKAMIAAMAPGSVIVDLAAERGGNCEGTVPGTTTIINGVSLVGPLNIPASIAFNASALYSKNMATFIENLFDKESQAIRFDDDIVAATMISKEGSLTHDKATQWIQGGTK